MRKTRSQTQAENNAQSAASIAPSLQSQPQQSHSYVPGSSTSMFPEYEELRNKVLCFRVNELQKLLTAFKVNHIGRKNELLRRTLDLLKINFNEVAPKVREIYKSCSRDGNNSPSEYGPPDPKRMFQPQIQLPVQSDVRTTLVSNNIVVPFAGNMTSGFPIHPDVRLKKLAFYDVLAQLLQPSTLVPTTTQRVQEQLFQFTLTPQQATEIASNRDIRNGSKVEHTIQVQLRFCLLETSCEQDDCFPPNVMLKVNNKVCALPNPIPTNRPNVEPTRPPRPVNVTPNVKLSPTVANNIVVQWVPDFTRGYVISGYLVRKLTSSQLLIRMKSKGIKPADYTRALIKEKLNEDADCEIATTMLRVSLLCPLGKMRMTIPCRASTCSHLQCFDASLYLQMNERKPTWNCPVCDRPATYDTLVIDGYFQEVLASQLLSPDDNEIQLHKDGSWSTHNLKNDTQVLDNSFCKTVQKVEVISDDLEVITTEPETRPATKPPAAVSSMLATVSSNNEPTSTTSNETVDLTLSDSEDDLPLKKRVAASKSSNTNGNGQKNMPTSNSTGSGKLKANDFAMPKKVTERSRGSRETKNVPKVRKVAKTGAERVREYRARIRALENAAATGSATNVEGMAIQTPFQQNLEDNQVDMRENQCSLLCEALSRQSSQDEQEAEDNHRQFVDQVDAHQQDLPWLSEAPSTSTMQMQSSTQKVTTLRRHSKTAKTPAERARAYRERKKALKNATNQQLMIDTTHSHVDDTVVHEEVALEAINVGTSTAGSQQCGARKRPYEHVVEPPSTSGAYKQCENFSTSIISLDSPSPPASPNITLENGGSNSTGVTSTTSLPYCPLPPNPLEPGTPPNYQINPMALRLEHRPPSERDLNMSVMERIIAGQIKLTHGPLNVVRPYRESDDQAGK